MAIQLVWVYINEKVQDELAITADRERLLLDYIINKPDLGPITVQQGANIAIGWDWLVDQHSIAWNTSFFLEQESKFFIAGSAFHEDFFKRANFHIDNIEYPVVYLKTSLFLAFL